MYDIGLVSPPSFCELPQPRALHQQLRNADCRTHGLVSPSVFTNRRIRTPPFNLSTPMNRHGSYLHLERRAGQFEFLLGSLGLDAHACHGLHSTSSYDHPVHVAASESASVNPSAICVRTRSNSSGPVRHLDDTWDAHWQLRPITSTHGTDL